MEELTLHYYLKLFSIIFFIIFFLFIVYFFFILNKKNILVSNIIVIEKGEKIENILNENIIDLSFIEIKLINLYYFINKKVFKEFIHYGDFEVKNNSSIISLLNIISKPSNILNKITIVEGWSSNQLNRELAKHFKISKNIPYQKIIADTYYFEKDKNFNLFVNFLNKIRKQYFLKFQNNELLKKYTENEIMIIGSLIEKEGLDYDDKKKISSVIFNRLEKKMKLQIDATVLFAITDGNYNLNRKLLINDLKIIHPFNTYVIDGLPPKPISYVGKKTLDIIFENYKSDFLFYFFNNSLKRHIFSKTFEDHKIKLNEYRNSK